jgi:hypothetical protein
MYTQLNWENPNVVAVTVKIYRGDAPLDRANLANPIATLSNGETTYKDTTVVRGQLYYYVFETTSPTDRVVSPNYPIRAVPRRGPGSNVLVQGDYNYGYFGSMASSQFTNANELRAKVGLTLGTSINVTPKWHKFARNGKILIIPEGVISTTVSWKQLYDLGLVFGVDGPGPYNAGAPVGQGVTVKIGPDTFRVRLMRGYSDDDYTAFAANTSVPEPIESFLCEWDDLVYPLVTYVPTVQRMANVAAVGPNQLSLPSSGAHVQEKGISAGSQVNVVRGSGAASRAGVATRNGFTYTNTANVGWWPVLELIETPVV